MSEARHTPRRLGVCQRPVLGLPFLVLGPLLYGPTLLVKTAMAFLLACVLLWWARPTSRLIHPVIGEPLELMAYPLLPVIMKERLDAR